MHDRLRQQQPCVEISCEAFGAGDFADEMNHLLILPKLDPVPASGIATGCGYRDGLPELMGQVRAL